MKRLISTKILSLIIVLLVMPLLVNAKAEQAKNEAMPPVEQPLVREGNLAVKLVPALGLGSTESEIEAENLLGAAGIAPRNGWIADYPATPDIMNEIRISVTNAADAKKIKMGKDETLKAFDNVAAEIKLSVRPYEPGETQGGQAPNCETYANPSVVNNYYNNYGPPVVSYYAPPPDYYYLYAWVPFPFFFFDFFFPGFFILHDFHKVVIINKTAVIISNHFNDVVTHNVFRIDPVQRFSGRTFAGIGAPSRKGFLSTGVRGSEQRIFNRSRTMAPSGGRTTIRPSGGRTVSPGRTMTAPPGGGARMAPAPGGRPMTAPPGGARPMAPSPGGGRGATGEMPRR